MSQVHAVFILKHKDDNFPILHAICTSKIKAGEAAQKAREKGFLAQVIHVEANQTGLAINPAKGHYHNQNESIIKIGR